MPMQRQDTLRLALAALSAHGLVASRKGKIPPVKILLRGEVGKSIHIEGCKISKGAREHIEKAGGTVVPV